MGGGGGGGGGGGDQCWATQFCLVHHCTTTPYLAEGGGDVLSGHANHNDLYRYVTNEKINSSVMGVTSLVTFTRGFQLTSGCIGFESGFESRFNLPLEVDSNLD